MCRHEDSGQGTGYGSLIRQKIVPHVTCLHRFSGDGMSVRWAAALGIIVGSYYVGNAVLVPMFV